jgi:PAS domain S-box-containing protein
LDNQATFNRTHCVIVDITKRKRLEEAQRRLSTAVEQAAEGILITDTQGTIQYVNPSLEHISGYDKTELLGTKSSIFKSDEHDQGFFKDLWETINAGKVWTGRFTNKRKDGITYYVDTAISPVRDSIGTIINFVAVERDVTEHLELSKQFLQAQKMEAIGNLAGGIAHDFNNLLQVILGHSEMLLNDEQLGEKVRADLRQIVSAGRSGAELIQRLMIFSRKTETNFRPTDLNYEVEQLKKMLVRTVPKMIEIELILTSKLAIINADPTQIGQILMNLAVNARDSMPDGGKLSIQTENVILDEGYCSTHPGVKPGDYVLMTVSDTGCGMDKETLGRIFEQFFTTKDVGKGTGLGLSVVYQIIRRHGGHIYCYSEPGHGTTFKIYLSAIPPKETIQEHTTEETAPKRGTETLLLVDDDESIREMIGQILSQAGYTVMTARDGEGALDLYKQEGRKISLVILNLEMPKMGGQKCLEKLLKLNPGVKVLIETGVSHTDEQTKLAIDSGARGSIHKPHDEKKMLRVVREILDKD